MTSLKIPVKKVQKIVLYFDFCSSTTILEDLLRSENERRWRDLLISIKNFLRNERSVLNFDMYKFIGDGWILLFDINVDPLRLFNFLERLCNKYELLFKQKIEPVLSLKITNIGITFGLDKGTLIRIVMNNLEEYIGRPLNVAARLQGAIWQKDSQPHGKVLMSRSAYIDMRKDLKGKYRVENATRELRNISGGEAYLCKKLWLFQQAKMKQTKKNMKKT